MLTSEQVEKIYKEHEDEYHELKGIDGFLDGLNLLASRGNSGDTNYAVEHDVFYGPGLADVPDLTEEDILKLNRLGWRFEEEFECFSKFV